MTTYLEPRDGSIVGWGSPVSAVKVRIDEYAVSTHPLERWYDASDNDVDLPQEWDVICAEQAHHGFPYLLTPTDLTSAPAQLPSAPAAESPTSRSR